MPHYKSPIKKLIVVRFVVFSVNPFRKKGSFVVGFGGEAAQTQPQNSSSVFKELSERTTQVVECARQYYFNGICAIAKWFSR
jgi:hypothetical protein